MDMARQGECAESALTDGLRYVGRAQGSAARANMLRRIPISRP